MIWPGTPHRAGLDRRCARGSPIREMPTGVGEAIEHTLHRELGLVGAEARGTRRTPGCSCAPRSTRRRWPARRTARSRGRRQRSSTFIPTDRVRRPSRRPSAPRSAVSRPSASHPAQYSMRIGCRLGWISSALLTRQRALHRALEQPRRERGLGLVRHVLLAAERAHRSTTSSTVTRPAVDAEHRGDLVAVVPDALAARLHVQAVRSVGHDTGAATVDSGSRKACSMRCVWNISCTTWALAASAASTSPRA